MSNSQCTHLNDKRFLVKNTKAATALMTLGVSLKNEVPVTRIYDPQRPASTGGMATWNLQETNSDGVPTKDLHRAYEQREADVEMDKLVDSLPEPYRYRVKTLLPMAYAAMIRTALENRERLVDFVKKQTPYVKVPRGNGFVLLPANASEETKRKLGVK